MIEHHRGKDIIRKGEGAIDKEQTHKGKEKANEKIKEHEVFRLAKFCVSGYEKAKTEHLSPPELGMLYINIAMCIFIYIFM